MPNFTPNEYQEKFKDIEIIFDSLQTESEEYSLVDTPDDKTSSDYSFMYSEQWDNLISLQNQLLGDIEEVIQNINNEDNKISKYDTDNNILETKYIDLSDKIQGAIGMKNDTQTLYNHMYYGNILIFLSIIGGSVLYARTRRL
jgi:hypothetical protein